MSNDFLKELNKLFQPFDEKIRQEYKNKNKEEVDKDIQENQNNYENNINKEREVLEKEFNELGPLNIIISGKPGIGKSTLINSVFGFSLDDKNKNRAETGIGGCVTKDIKAYTNYNIPFLTIIDTPGTELFKAQDQLIVLKSYISEKNRDKKAVDEKAVDEKAVDYIHIAWYCIHEAPGRIEEGDIEFITMFLEQEIPVVVIITQAKQDITDGVRFESKVKQLLTKSFKNTKYSNSIPAIVRVMAKPMPDVYEYTDETGRIIQEPKYVKRGDKFIESIYPVIGLIDLASATGKVLPKPQQVSLNLATLKTGVEKANKFMRIGVIAAFSEGVIHGAFPHPQHPGIVASIQALMLTAISQAFGLSIDKAILEGVLTASFAAGIATTIGAEVFNIVSKFIPGLNVMSIGISGLFDAFSTVIIGLAYIETIKYMRYNNIEITQENIQGILKEQIAQVRNLKPITEWMRDNNAYPESLAKIIDTIYNLIDKISKK